MVRWFSFVISGGCGFKPKLFSWQRNIRICRSGDGFRFLCFFCDLFLLNWSSGCNSRSRLSDLLKDVILSFGFGSRIGIDNSDDCVNIVIALKEI